MNLTLKPVFSFSIEMKLSEKGVVIQGKSVIAITQGNKIIIQQSSQKTWSEVQNDIGMLSVNHQVTALATGKLSDNGKEYLAIGTEANILVYKVDENLEVFFKEVKESIKCMTIGSFNETPLLFYGSDSAVRGLNEKGEECFLVLAGKITSLLLFDFNGDNERELILGSENKIKIYKKEKFLMELPENSNIHQIVPIGDHSLAYILTNGTIGVYQEQLRLWRNKSKLIATAITNYDLLGTGSQQLVTGWDNGKIDVRDPKCGDVLMKLTTPSKVISLLVSDYRGSGKPDLICITENGDILGYASSNVNLAPLTVQERSQIKELLNLKQNLLLEMSHYENNAKVNENILESDDSVNATNQLKTIADNFAVIPANTRLQIGISTNVNTSKKSCVEIGISTSNSTIIKAVIIFAEGIFENSETLIIHPPPRRVTSNYGSHQSSSGVSKIVIPLKIQKDEVYDVHIKAFVGFEEANSNQFHVFELNRQLPKFCSYGLPEQITGSPKTLTAITKMHELQSGKIPEGYVRFKTNDRVNRICLWINQNFLLPADIEPQTLETENFNLFKIPLVCLRDNSILEMTYFNDNTIQFQTDDLELAGNLVQSLALFLNLQNLESVAYFPNVIIKMKQLFERLNGLQESYKNFRTDTVMKVNLAKRMIIRAEDSIITNMDKLANYYNELMGVNEDLTSNFKIRSQTYEEIQRSLGMINDFLYKSTKLRVGQPATEMMSNYKDALEMKDIEKIVQIMEISG